jgi:hypothetical protein
VQAVDSTPLASLTTSINSFEVPEVHTADDHYYDLLNQFDFRPIAANTAVPTTNAAAATVNPAETLSFGNTTDPTNDKRRDFIAMLCSTAAAWPSPHARSSPIPMIGFLNARSATDTVGLAAAFRQALNEVGFVDGRTAGRPTR